MLNRRSFLRAALLSACSTALLGGCAATTPSLDILPTAYVPPMYGPLLDGNHLIPGIEPGVVDAIYFRRVVDDPTGEPPGTVVVDPHAKFLYLVLEDGTAMRYGIGVGRAGFAWSGRAVIAWKRPWPTWTPPLSMMEREPSFIRYAGGMEPGLDNPLGARALYLFKDGRDTLYRLHGTNDPTSIGKAVSSGCIRLLNQDVIDLYERIPTGSEVAVLEAPLQMIVS